MLTLLILILVLIIAGLVFVVRTLNDIRTRVRRTEHTVDGLDYYYNPVLRRIRRENIKAK